VTPLRIGVAGLGRAFTLMMPTFVHDPRVQLVAACDPQPQACAQFERDFQAPSVGSIAALCQRPDVDWVYVATPHQFHAEHVVLAAQHGKHVLVEKPMAIHLADCTRMIEACAKAHTALIVGHSHSFNGPVLLAHQLIRSGRYGRVRMIHALQYTDFLYRPRRPEELQTDAGGGVIHSQAAHQVDMVRLLGGGLVRSVTAHTGNWDAERPTEGAYSALLSFEGGAFASMSYSGYGHFDSDAWMDGINEMGFAKASGTHGGARARLRSVADAAQEAALKAERNYGGRLWSAPVTDCTPQAHSHFGPVIIGCEHADLRLTPSGVAIDGHDAQHFEAVPLGTVPRQEVIDEMVSAQSGQATLHNGHWARASTAVSLALLQSAQGGLSVCPEHQVAPVA
jgi:phthalate 4,5-cis-dihydrodiol dehydrogenase